MMLPDKSGIACDMCAGQYRLDFQYYSMDFRPVEMADGLRRRTTSAVVLSLDVCSLCWGKLAESVKVNYRPVANGVVCDLSGVLMSGTCKYYDCEVAKVTVKPSGQRMQITPDPRFVDLVVSQGPYEAMASRLLQLRKAGDTWSSTASSHQDQSPNRQGQTRTTR